MKNELLTIGPFTIYGYGLMLGLAVIAAYLTTEYRARKLRLRYEHVFALVIWCAVFGFAGAKLLFLITEWKYVLHDPVDYLLHFADGFVVYGGIIGGTFGGWLYCRRHDLPFMAYFDLAMPSIAIAQCIGRIGCFLAGCCYGKETTSHIAITFHESEFAPNGVPLIPTQVYSSLLNLLHFFLLLWISRHKTKDGQVAASYLIFYGIGRFLMEFLRGDLERGTIGSLSTSQFISIFITVGGVLLFMILTGFTSQKALKKAHDNQDQTL